MSLISVVIDAMNVFNTGGWPRMLGPFIARVVISVVPHLADRGAMGEFMVVFEPLAIKVFSWYVIACVLRACTFSTD